MKDLPRFSPLVVGLFAVVVLQAGVIVYLLSLRSPQVDAVPEGAAEQQPTDEVAVEEATGEISSERIFSGGRAFEEMAGLFASIESNPVEVVSVALDGLDYGESSMMDLQLSLIERTLWMVPDEELPEVVALFEAFGFGEERLPGDFTTALMRRWAQVDPEAAIVYATERIGGDESTNALFSVFRAMEEEGRSDWMVSYMDLVPEERRGEFSQLIVDRKVDQGDMRSVLAWADGLEQGGVKTAAYERVAERWAEQDLRAAADWLKGVAGREDVGYAAGVVVNRWMQYDVEGAARWAIELPEHEGKESIAAGALNQWARADPVAAGSYLLENSESNSLSDAYLESYSIATVDREPSIALDVAASIEDPDLRLGALTQVVINWRQRSTAEADAALESYGLPQETVDAIRYNIENGEY